MTHIFMDTATRLKFIKVRHKKIQRDMARNLVLPGAIRECNHMEDYVPKLPFTADTAPTKYDILDELVRLPAFSLQENSTEI